MDYITVVRSKPLGRLQGVLEEKDRAGRLLLSETVDGFGRKLGLVLVWDYQRVERSAGPAKLAPGWPGRPRLEAAKWPRHEDK